MAETDRPPRGYNTEHKYIIQYRDTTTRENKEITLRDFIQRHVVIQDEGKMPVYVEPLPNLDYHGEHIMNNAFYYADLEPTIFGPLSPRVTNTPSIKILKSAGQLSINRGYLTKRGVFYMVRPYTNIYPLNERTVVGDAFMYLADDSITPDLWNIIAAFYSFVTAHGDEYVRGLSITLLNSPISPAEIVQQVSNWQLLPVLIDVLTSGDDNKTTDDYDIKFRNITEILHMIMLSTVFSTCSRIEARTLKDNNGLSYNCVYNDVAIPTYLRDNNMIYLPNTYSVKTISHMSRLLNTLVRSYIAMRIPINVERIGSLIRFKDNADDGSNDESDPNDLHDARGKQIIPTTGKNVAPRLGLKNKVVGPKYHSNYNTTLVTFQRVYNHEVVLDSDDDSESDEGITYDHLILKDPRGTDFNEIENKLNVTLDVHIEQGCHSIIDNDHMFPTQHDNNERDESVDFDMPVLSTKYLRDIEVMKNDMSVVEYHNAFAQYQYERNDGDDEIGPEMVNVGHNYNMNFGYF